MIEGTVKNNLHVRGSLLRQRCRHTLLNIEPIAKGGNQRGAFYRIRSQPFIENWPQSLGESGGYRVEHAIFHINTPRIFPLNQRLNSPRPLSSQALPLTFDGEPEGLTGNGSLMPLPKRNSRMSHKRLQHLEKLLPFEIHRTRGSLRKQATQGSE